MKNELQIKRIGEFIDSLDHSELMDGQQQAIILQSEISYVGGDNSGRLGCSNSDTLACSGTNKNCTNHGVCGASDNTRDCKNLPGLPGKPGVQ